MHNQGQQHWGGGGGATAPPIFLLGGRCPPKHRGYQLSLGGHLPPKRNIGGAVAPPPPPVLLPLIMHTLSQCMHNQGHYTMSFPSIKSSNQSLTFPKNKEISILPPLLSYFPHSSLPPHLATLPLLKFPSFQRCAHYTRIPMQQVITVLISYLHRSHW